MPTLNLENCYGCNKDIDTMGDTIYRRCNGNIYCQECADTRLRNCPICDNNVDIRTQRRLFNNNYYHQRCFGNNYFYCSECGDATSQDECYCHEGRGEDFCQNCWESLGLSNDDEDSCRENCIEFESTRVSLVKVTHKHLRYTRCFGIELEVNDENLPYDDIERHTCFGSKYDSSLNVGSEFYSPILKGDTGYKEIQKLCSAMGDVHIGTCAGYHLHIDARDISWQETKKIWLTYHIFEGVLYGMLPHSRQDNGTCQKSPHKIDEILSINSRRGLENMWYSIVDEDRHDHYNSSRYHGFNLHSLFYQSTIEIRYHSSTINFEKIINWVKINQCIFNYAVNHSVNEILALRDFKNCKTNYTRIRKLFKKVIGKDNLWKYYKKRFERFNNDKKDFGWYNTKIHTSESITAESEVRANVQCVGGNIAIPSIIRNIAVAVVDGAVEND